MRQGSTRVWTRLTIEGESPTSRSLSKARPHKCSASATRKSTTEQKLYEPFRQAAVCSPRLYPKYSLLPTMYSDSSQRPRPDPSLRPQAKPGPVYVLHGKCYIRGYSPQPPHYCTTLFAISFVCTQKAKAHVYLYVPTSHLRSHTPV